MDMVDVTNRGDYCKAQTATVSHNSSIMDKRAVVVVILAIVITAVTLTVTLTLCLRQRTGYCEGPASGGDDKTLTGDKATRSCGHPSTPGTNESSNAWFRFASVASDNGRCSSIGTEFLGRRGGSVVDAAIASLLCLGMVNSQHTGVGGGVIFIIYDRPHNGTEKELVTLVGRETASLSARADMFDSDPAAQLTGPLSISVPGEINGYYTAWQRFGRLPWAMLFEPVIKMCRGGWTVSDSMAKSIKTAEDTIRNDQYLREAYVKSDDSLYEAGDKMTNAKMARTFQAIADDGPDAFYRGALTRDIVDDIQEAGGNLTTADFASNKAVWEDALTVVLNNGNYSVHAAPPPSSGVVVQFILKVMDGYNLKIGSFNSAEEKTLLLHRLVETWKFAFARREQLADVQFPNDEVDKWLAKLQNTSYAEEIRRQINDNGAFPLPFYYPVNEDKDGNSTRQDTGGTGHLSVLASDGAAVSVTSTVGSLFGSKIVGNRTGIVFNNMMDLFTLPAKGNISANHIAPGKRGRSSVSPIMVRGGDGQVALLAGAAGSRRIVTATSFVAVQNLWLGVDLAKAVNHPRVHYQLKPDVFYYDKQMPKDILDGLKRKGHTNFTLAHTKYPYLAVVEAIDAKTCIKCQPNDTFNSCIHAVSDYRKNGMPDGY
ncbi:Glutathione hydrolase 1 proenzyme [Lamellibrachia satsuma]|nr:Glutathione hydrolase 1 proenzyme [Lamellibrachia satsuma]